MTPDERARWRDRLREQKIEVRLLFDENLPRSLTVSLKSEFPDSKHVSDADLLNSDDTNIWDYAAAFHFAIVTKDRDFAEKAKAEGPPPSIVQLTVGNCPVWALVDLLMARAKDIKTHIQFGGDLLQIGVAEV